MDERCTKEQLWKLIGEDLKRTEDFLLLYSLEALKEYEENAERIQGIPLEPFTWYITKTFEFNSCTFIATIFTVVHHSLSNRM